MSHLRQNVITKDWVIFATERSKRPHEFARSHDDIPPELPSYKHGCPFCQGNENPSETEYLRIEDERGWRVRIIPNKYPALSVSAHVLAAHRMLMKLTHDDTPRIAFLQYFSFCVAPTFRR